MYHKYFEHDDGGRASAGYVGKTGDCVVRAIAIATGRPYSEVYSDMKKLTKQYAITRRDKVAKALNGSKRAPSPRGGTYKKVYHDYILEHGFKWVATMQVGSGCKVHLRKDELPDGTLIVQVSKHLCTVIDGTIHDIGDPSREGTRCVYGYYKKEE